MVPLPASKVTHRDAPITQKQIDVLDALNLSIFAEGATFTQLVEHLNVAKSSLNYSLTKLKDRGYIQQAGRGTLHRYCITESGRDVLLVEELDAVQSRSVPFSLSIGDTELTLNWHIKTEVLRSVAVQSAMASQSGSSVQFSPSSGVVQSNGSSSVQSAPL